MTRYNPFAPAAPVGEAAVLAHALQAVETREEARWTRRNPGRAQSTRYAAKAPPASPGRKGGPSKARVEVVAVTLSANEQQDGYELRFPSRESGLIPDYLALCEVLRAHRWGFAKMNHGYTVFDPRWYARRTPEQLAFGLAIVQKYGGKSDVPAVTINQQETP